jgi:hypothetical protein
VKITVYEREVAFRALDSKFCPGCGLRKNRMLQCFCNDCEKKLTVGVQKGLHNRASFAWAYYEALKLLEELRKSV